MEELFRSGNDEYGDIIPDAIYYTSIMNDWSGCGLKVELRRTKQILRHMRDLRDSGYAAAVPDSVVYNTALKAWTLCRE